MKTREARAKGESITNLAIHQEHAKTYALLAPSWLNVPHFPCSNTSAAALAAYFAACAGQAIWGSATRKASIPSSR